MRRCILVLMGLVFVLGATASQGEWKMRVEHATGADELALSDVDNITFHDRPRMVAVPAGVFTMGDGESYCGVNERQVTLTRDFYLSCHEITNRQYMHALQWAYDHGYVTATTGSADDNLDGSTVRLVELGDEDCEIAFDGAGGFHLRESPSGYAQGAYPGGYDPSSHPVMKVSWYGAARYCDWLSLLVGFPRAYQHGGDWSCNGGDPYGAAGYRLPTDAEWEYAAQFDDERLYPWGNAEPHCGRANYHPNPDPRCIGWTSPVGSYPEAPQILELADMAGNVWEYCNDWFSCDLGTASVTDPAGPGSGSDRVMRSGSWYNYAMSLRCAMRFGYVPQFPPDNTGFRIARTMSP
ncbi:MAG: SUMF1/EgtB/PvdO family nonheme iron enzyme [Candidatus Eisenbacteria sp.]|nr:SUMF1/EgtB/PvdO family nonheme iron enzyme [Candidatus Eisenbacteria bacterium]